MSNLILIAKIKKTGETIEVYKLRDGRYNKFLGDSISVSKLEAGEHMKTFDSSELEIIK
jgi:hypothetical protein